MAFRRRRFSIGDFSRKFSEILEMGLTGFSVGQVRFFGVGTNAPCSAAGASPWTTFANFVLLS